MKKLYFKEKAFKLLDHYPIENENGEEEYYLDQDLSFIGYKARVSDAEGRELFNIKREMISFMPRYSVDFDNGYNLVVQKKVSFAGKKIDVFFDGDMVTLHGDLINLNYQVENGQGELIGAVNKKFLSLADSYELIIYNPRYEQQLIALTICLNNINDVDEASASS